MLHVRVVSPTGATDEVVRALRDERGATNVVLLRGASLEPAGDVVQADVAREAVDGLLDRLRRLCLERGGSVTLEQVDTALGEHARRAEEEAPGEGVDAVVWEQVTARTQEEASLSATYLLFLVVATLIASVGLLTDSQVLIVGAMVLGPEFGPLAGTALAVVQRQWGLARRSAAALLVGFPVAVLVTAGFVAALDGLGLVPDGYRQGRQTFTAFVTSPDVFSVVVALLAGVAGTVSLTASKSSTLVGVFISVTTVPAAAGIATAGVTGYGGRAVGAAVQLGVNLVCIVLAAVVTLQVQRRFAPGSREPAGPVRSEAAAGG